MAAPEQAAEAWVYTHGQGARRHVYLAVMFGSLQTVVVVGQMYALALALHAAVIERALTSAPVWALWVIPVCILARAALGLARDECGLRAGQAARQSLRAQLLDTAYRGGPLWNGGIAGGALSNVVNDQVDAVDGYFARYRPQRLLAGIVPVLILLAVLPHSWVAALILLGTAPLIPLFMVLVGWRTRAEQSRQMLAMQRLGGAFLDLVRGMPTLRLFDARQRSLDELAVLGEAFRERTMRVLRLAFLNGTVLEFFASVAIALSAVYLGFSLLGTLNFGFFDSGAKLQSALFILLLAPEFYQPLRELGVHYHARAEALAATISIRQVLDSLPDEATHSAEQALPAPTGAATLRFNAVTLSYQEGVPALAEFALRVREGECVALTGPSGSGKSSVLRLAAGIVLPTQGAVHVDDYSMIDLDRHVWREHIGWMDQSPPLLAASLADNLLAARMDADTAELWSALVFAGLQTWAEALPEGLDTILGEGGRLLSGGQLRRLALARLALRRPRLLLLDEPTASLDAAAEAFVVERLAELRAGCTTLLATHRPAPLVLANRVLKLAGGRMHA
jgi:ATP-binding cassette subfamily C protein CydD